jgi:hypothetical protein
MWAVLVSIFSLDFTVGFSMEPREEVEDAFWMRHDTAADATSLKSASVAVGLGPVDDVLVATTELFPSLETEPSAAAAVIENTGEMFLW